MVLSIKFYAIKRLKEANALKAVESLTDLGSVVESYDLKLSVQNKGKVDIRLKFIDGIPKIMAVRRDEEKLLITDILCLHRYVYYSNLVNLWPLYSPLYHCVSNLHSYSNTML